MAYALDGIVRDVDGVPVSDALVYIFSPEGVLADLYDDLGDPIENPRGTDQVGVWSAFSKAEGFHTVKINYGGRERKAYEQLVGEDPITRAESAAGTAEAFTGPTFSTVADGLANTLDGAFFAVNSGGIVTIYLNDAGSAVYQRDVATTAVVSITVASKAAMAALSVSATVAVLNGDNFDRSANDLSSWVSRDPTRSVIIPFASDPTGASGAWVRRGPWALGTVYATWFGFVADSNGTAGNGADNTAALQAAIDFVCPFQWKGSTRATELQGSFSGEVILPKGIGRITAKVKLAPNLTLRGQGAANDWTVRTGIAGTAAGTERMGTALFCDIANFGTYALDTCPYNAAGSRLNDTTVAGGDSSGGLKTQVANFRMFSMTLYGNWTCKALNLAGAESCYIADDVLIRGFTVGVRASATWYGKFRARVLHNWRGCIAYLSATDLDLSASSWWKPVEAPVYNPVVSGWDGTEPTRDTWWTDSVLAKTAHIFNHYSNLYGSNIACELGDYMFMSKNGVNDFTGIYTEGATAGIIFTEGPDQQNEMYQFDTIVTSTAPFIYSKNARLHVEVAHHNNQNGYSRVIGDLVNTLGYEGVPTLNGVKLTAADGLAGWTDQSIAYGEIAQLQGPWVPAPKFGAGNSDSGSGTKAGRWVRIGNMVTVSATVTIQTVSAATGTFTIEGLPFRVRNFFGLDAPCTIAFLDGGPAITRGRGEANGYKIIFDNITQTGWLNGANIRLQMTYETDEYGPWGW